MNFKQQHFHHGFTLMEIIIVVITLGVITSLAFSNYSKTIERNYCSNAQMNLIAISNAAIIRNLKDPSTIDITGIAGINTALNLNIIDPRFDYIFNSSSKNYTSMATRRDGPVYQCTIVNSPTFALNCTSSEDNFCPKVLP